MSAPPIDKHKVLQAGGQFADLNESVEEWLEFITNPENLKPGLPRIELKIGPYGSSTISISFSETIPSLSSIWLRLGMGEDEAEMVFQEPEKAKGSADPENPSHYKKWILGLFRQSELREMAIEFILAELPDLFDQLPKLSYVLLSNSRIRRLPPSFFRLPALRTLNLYATFITELPEEFGQLKSLHSLTFSQKILPGVLGKLSGLEYLYCHHSEFTVPEDIIHLHKLKSLYLASVKSAPSGLINFPNLENLHFGFKRSSAPIVFSTANVPKLKSLTTNNPAAFATVISSCVALENLSMDYLGDDSGIEIFGKSLGHLQHFKSIIMRAGRMKEMEFCSALTHLETIDLSKNQITRIPDLSKLHKLRKLDLKENRIVEIGELPPNIEYLDLDRNGVVEIPLNLAKLKNLKLFSLVGNPLTDIPDLPVMPSVLDFQFNHSGIMGEEESPPEAILQKITRIFPNAKLSYERMF